MVNVSKGVNVSTSVGSLITPIIKLNGAVAKYALTSNWSSRFCNGVTELSNSGIIAYCSE